MTTAEQLIARLELVRLPREGGWVRELGECAGRLLHPLPGHPQLRDQLAPPRRGGVLVPPQRGQYQVCSQRQQQQQ